MTGLLIFLIIIVFVISYILFAPFYVAINSINGTLTIRFHSVFIAQMYSSEDSLFLDLRIVGFRKKIDLFSKTIKKKKISEHTINKRSKSISLRKIKGIINSFKVNTFYLSISFDNMLLNGILYPLCTYLKVSSNKKVEINFINENEIILEIENNFYRIIRAYIKS